MSGSDATKDVEAEYDDVASISKASLASEQAGVSRVEAAQKVWGPYTRWILYAGLFLSAYVYSLDGYCASVWNFRVTSAFDDHSLLSAVATAQAIVISLFKIVFAKWADVFGRPQSVALSLFFYLLGFILLAAASTIGAAAAGFIFYAVGYSGLQILIQIVIADTTTLRWRGLTAALFTAPFLINFAVGAKIAAHFAPAVTATTAPGYPHLLRWGYGMFCIVFPVALAPLIITLWWGDRKAVKVGLAPTTRFKGDSVVDKSASFLSEIDIVGLLLLLAALGLILEPTSLAGSTYGNPVISWSDTGTLVPCYVIGALAWPILIFWEFRFARHPILPKRVFLNRSIIGVCLFNVFDFISFYLQYPYLASYIQVCTEWSQDAQNYFLNTRTVSLTVFALVFGSYVAVWKRYKWAILVGLIVRLIGVSTMIAARGNPSSVAGLVITQIVQGVGGGFASIGGAVAAQAAVPHQDVAIATALPLLFAEIGNAVGNSIAGAIWRSRMPNILTTNLQGILGSADIEVVYQSAVTAATYPFGSPARNAIIQSYEQIMHTLLVAATIFSVPPLFAVLLLHNYEAGSTQNAVEPRNLVGERTDLGEHNQHTRDAPMLEQIKETTKL